MKSLLIALTVFSLLGFANFTRADDTTPPAKKSHFHKGTFVSADKGKLIYKSPKGKENKIKIDDKTTVTLDGKDAKIEDLKEGYTLVIHYDESDKKLATSIVAKTAKPTTAPSEK